MQGQPFWKKAALVIALGGAFLFFSLTNGRFALVCDASGAMEPTLRPGECVLVAPFERLRRADVVAFLEEGRRSVRLGRIVATPGEQVTLRDGVFAIENLDYSSGCSAPLVERGSRLDPVEGLPPQDALTRWRQSNSAIKREVWPCGEDYLVYFRDGGERWRLHALDVRLGPEVFAVAPDNRDDGAPVLLGGSAVVGRAWLVVWTPFKDRLFRRLD